MGPFKGHSGTAILARDFRVSKSAVFLHSILIRVHRRYITSLFNESNACLSTYPAKQMFHIVVIKSFMRPLLIAQFANALRIVFAV